MIVPAPPVFSSSGASGVELRCAIVAPVTDRSPDAEVTLLDRLTRFCATMVTAPLPVVTVLLIDTVPVEGVPPEA